jgi:hypothetical protein
VNGSKVFTVNIISNSEVINLSNLAKGVYFGNLLTGSTKRIIKLIKE